MEGGVRLGWDRWSPGWARSREPGGGPFPRGLPFQARAGSFADAFGAGGGLAFAGVAAGEAGGAFCQGGGAFGFFGGGFSRARASITWRASASLAMRSARRAISFGIVSSSSRGVLSVSSALAMISATSVSSVVMSSPAF